MQVIDPMTGKGIVSIIEGYLTRDEFPDVYNRCSEAIHSHPFVKGGFNYEQLEKDIPIWITKITMLLNIHQIQLLNEKEQLWVVMHTAPNGQVHTALMERVDNPGR
jgi:hypothetical protein